MGNSTYKAIREDVWKTSFSETCSSRQSSYLAGTNEDDLILDPFSGSGTTAVVAEQHNRRWIMIEKEDTYNQIAKLRIDDVSNGFFEENAIKEVIQKIDNSQTLR